MVVTAESQCQEKNWKINSQRIEDDEEEIVEREREADRANREKKGKEFLLIDDIDSFNKRNSFNANFLKE